MYRKEIFMILLAVILALQLNAQNFTREKAVPFVLNFSAEDYHAHEQNFDILQGLDGKMYFANFAGILEYDGTNWNKIPMKNGMRVLSLTMNSKGQIFAGGLSDFGYLKHNMYGKTSFFSLTSLLKKEEIGKISHVVSSDSVVYFLSEEKMYIYENDTIVSLELENKAQSAFFTNNKLFVFFEPNKKFPQQSGLTLFTDSKFIKLSSDFDGEILDIQEMLDFPANDGIAIITSTQGFFMYRNELISKMPIALNNYMKKHSISGVEPLSGNIFALGTSSGGLVFETGDGEIIQVIDKFSKLQSESINQVFLDKKNALWLATNNGISKVEFSFPISYINNTNSGLEGKVLKILEFSGRIFVATNKGLFYLNESKFIKINRLNFACWDILTSNDLLLIASSNGIFTLSESLNLNKTAIDKFTFCLLKSKNEENIIYSGHSNEVLKLQLQKSNLKLQKSIPTILGDVTKILEENENLFIESTPNRIYQYNSVKQELIRIESPREIVSLHLNKKGKRVFLSSEKGLYSINLEKNQLERFLLFKSDTSSYHLWLHDLFYYSSNECVLTDGDMRNINICTEDTAVASKNKDNYLTVFEPISDFSVQAFFRDSKTKKLWLGGKDGLIIVDNEASYNYKTSFSTLLTKITSLQNDSLIETGNSKKEILELEYNMNSLRFEFSVPVFPAKGKVEYRYFLQGFDKDTSAWTTSTQKDYTNLPDEKYIFIVEAKNEFGLKSQAANLHFHILTPLFRRWWALLTYLVIIWLIGRFVLKWRMKAAQEEKAALEEIVRERTQEIYESKKKTEEQRDIAYKQKKHILDSISYAKKIQEAVLPSHEYVKTVLFEHFILFKPRDIVSGDFYWIKKVGDFVVTVAADSTGHGVPGAFMSMLGGSFLTEIVTANNAINAGTILDELRLKVKKSLHQEGKEGEQKDGMDLALTVIDFNKLEVYFAGAYNPLYIIRKTDSDNENPYELIQIKADRQPIGIYIKEKPFTTKNYKLQKGDSLYSFSDGYADQFGGETGDKFKAKRFRELLLSIQDKTMDEQKEILDRSYIKWKRDLEQIDDVIVMGVRI